MPEAKHMTYNHDVAAICNRVTRFVTELYKSVSSGVSLVNQFDQERWGRYLDATDIYITHIQAQPQLDLPESHPRMIEINCLSDEDILAVENESIKDALYYFKLAQVELMNSQSGRLAAGLISFDEKRCRALIEKSRRLLEDYVKQVTPLDLPESSPQREMTGPGKQGV